MLLLGAWAWLVSSASKISLCKGVRILFSDKLAPLMIFCTAACTIFTPVGPPLLLASILFGGGATAVNAGSEAVNYRCEPNKMADRILTLHAIISSIARLPDMMSKEEEVEEEKHAIQMKCEEDQSRLHWARTAMNGLKPLTAGALSAISIVTEAREMKNAVDKIRAGNPCEKAERLALVKNEIGDIPKTEVLSEDLGKIVSRQEIRAAEMAEAEDLAKTSSQEEDVASTTTQKTGVDANI